MKAALDFPEKVFSLVKGITKGKVSTYKDIAMALGKPRHSRLIGQILKSNKNPFILADWKTEDRIPCHRVVGSDGSLGGYFGSDKINLQKKIGLLKKEGVEIIGGKIDLKKYRYAIG